MLTELLKNGIVESIKKCGMGVFVCLFVFFYISFYYYHANPKIVIRINFPGHVFPLWLTYITYEKPSQAKLKTG